MRNRYRPRWPLLLALIGGIGILVALAYLPSQDLGEDLPTPGGEYVEGGAGSHPRVTPLFAAFNEIDRDLTSLVFSGLVRLGPKGEVLSDLAEPPKVTPDGLTYIFELRRGLLWHDGEPLDAGDVVFTGHAVQAPDFQGDPVLADLFRDVEVDAPHTSTVTMP